MKFRRRFEIKSGIDLTPMIDIIITIAKEGQIYVNGEGVNDIDAHLSNLSNIEGELEKPVEIRSDEDVRTQILISVIDSVKNAGFTRLSIATDSVE